MYGVPHTEVDLILANGEPVEFSFRIQDGDRISIFPLFRSLDIGAIAHIERHAPERFLLDGHLGRLAAYLRMLGFDTLCETHYGDEELVRISAEQDRTLLSRNRGLLKRSVVKNAYLIRETQPLRQLVEVTHRFRLRDVLSPFQRCMRCNTLLQHVAKAEVSDRLLPKTRKSYDEFQFCPGCDRVYWKGPHYTRMKRMVEALRESVPQRS